MDTPRAQWQRNDRVKIVGGVAGVGEFATLVRPDKTTSGEPGWLVKRDDSFGGDTIATRHLRRI